MISDDSIIMLANKLGIAFDTVKGTLIQQVHVALITTITFYVLWVLVAFLNWKAWRYIKDKNGYVKYKDEKEFFIFLVSIALAFGLFLLLCNLGETLTLIMNPDAWVLKEAANILKK